MNKLPHSIDVIKAAVANARRPAAMLSFGKDSMVMAHIIRASVGVNPLRAHAYPIDVIYHRDPWFPHKSSFADSVIRSWSMEVHDFPPMTTGVKVKPDMLELVARYSFGIRELDIPKNVCSPQDYPRRDFICGYNDWINRPKSFVMHYPWDVVFIGHKSSDVDQFDGAIPLKADTAKGGAVNIVFPLREWSDDDVWNYIDEHKIPVQQARYHIATKSESNWHSNDHINACTACIDPRVTTPTVFCPKLKTDVPNHGAEVFQLRTDAEYIERAA
jgi:3'-phosphoadenosine 5'-phosphosulfate sulfotransferase (PAPS reductase)/FAD synthetase